MTIIQLIHNVMMVILIGLFVMAAARMLISSIGEEKRKSADGAGVLLDKYMSKLTDCAIKVVKEVSKEVKEENKPRAPVVYENKYDEVFGQNKE